MFMWDFFKNRAAFALATDMEVNSYIENLPASACRASAIGLSEGLGTKVYYDEIMKYFKSKPKEQPQPNDDGDDSNDKDGDGESEEYPKGFDRIDNHDTWKTFRDTPEATQQLIQNQINSLLVDTADQVSKSAGSIPGNLKEIIEKLKDKKPEVFDWKSYFRKLLGTIYDINLRLTRRKPSKRYSESPGVQHRKKVSMLVAVDTSGSVSNKELSDFFNEIDYIYRAGARITILECDTCVNSVTEYDGKTIPEIKGRGGTNFNPVIEWYIEHKKEYASLVYFTDGYCSLPQKHPSNVIWIITSSGCEQDYPGKTIYIPKENEDKDKVH